MATRTEVIKTLCASLSKIGEEIFANQLEHDCICEDRPTKGLFDPLVNDQIVQFLVAAVNEKISRTKEIEEITKRVLETIELERR